MEPIKPHTDDRPPPTLNYARPSRVPNEIASWIGLVISLAASLLAFIVFSRWR